MSEKSTKGGHITGVPYGALPRLAPTGVETQEHGPLFFCPQTHNDFDDYQRWTRSTAVYPRTTSVVFAYLALGLNGEAGEVAEHFKKVLRGDDSVIAHKTAVVKELGDVLWYLARLADELGFNLSEVARMNRDKLSRRAERGTLKGSGDDR